ncbi:hypothetical protein [Pareuzebyella sediminis]|uniref:hypothetical protein n=1 Tax=Pareuzebyella sediminis TaxID=2607998 RepID=UPI0011EBB8FC|nr:hypothetical protein [Pareuzebyella sediminis]
MRVFLILLFFGFVTLGCDKIDDLTKFNMEYATEVTIPSSTGIDLPFDLFTPEMETNSESQFEVNDTRKDLIEQIKLTELLLTITSPSNADFSFLESIDIYISAEGLDEIKIASEASVDPDTGNTLDVDVIDIDIKEYIKKDKFNLRLNTVTDEVMSTDHKIEVHSIFFVDAKILGI